MVKGLRILAEQMLGVIVIIGLTACLYQYHETYAKMAQSDNDALKPVPGMMDWSANNPLPLNLDHSRVINHPIGW